MGGQAFAKSRQSVDHLKPILPIMDEQIRRLAPRIKIGARHEGDLRDGFINRQEIGLRRPRWADRAAIPATAANPGVNRDRVANAGDRAGGANIKAFRTAGDAVAGMRAKIFIESDINRLFKITDHGAGLVFNLRKAADIIGIGAEIAIAFLPAGEKRRVARQINQHIALAFNTTGHRAVSDGRAAMGQGFGEMINRQREIGEMALRLFDDAGGQGEGEGFRHHFRVIRGKHHRHPKVSAQFFGQCNRRVTAPVNQTAPI